MDPNVPLEGACSCGRNHYLIHTSSPVSRHLQVVVDDRARDSRLNLHHSRNKYHQTYFLPGYPVSIRIPLSHLHSTTYALYPDETHSAIRRVFTPYHAPHTKRHFCGFCGTPLSSWSEETPEEAEWIAVNLSSLRNESVERLQEAGFLAVPEEASTEAEAVNEPSQQSPVVPQQGSGRQVRGVPWFEELVEGSELGRIKRRRGGQTSADGRTKYEWEIVEVGGEEADTTATGTAKRKLGVMGAGHDVEMRSGYDTKVE